MLVMPVKTEVCYERLKLENHMDRYHIEVHIQILIVNFVT